MGRGTRSNPKDLSHDLPVHAVASDRPLTDPADDRLGYAPFARMLAASVLQGCPADGLVVSIYGDWGLGKTTLLNFLAREVEQDPDDPPIVVRFNPWWFSDRDDLIRRFFNEFEAAALKRGKRGRAIVKAAETLGKAVSNIPIGWAASAGKVVAGIAKQMQPGDIAGLKQQLADALAADAFRVLVLIDDIDRLLPDDMLEVLRLVKAIGDLPNVIYVLAFDHEATCAALKERFGSFGARYLEKIVQVQFDLPRPRPEALGVLFSQRLAALLVGVPEGLVDESRMSRLYEEAIQPLLRTPRDIVRLLNAMAVTFPAVIREVNTVDFLGVETLRLHFPKAYDVLRRQSSHFVGIHATLGRTAGENMREQEDEFHENWLKTVGDSRAQVEALMAILFPGILPGHSSQSTNASALRRARRICTEEHFEKYFQYSLTTDELSRDEFLLLVNLEREEDVKEVIEALSKQGPPRRLRFLEFMQALRDHTAERKHLKNPEHFIQSLCPICDLLFPTDGEREDLLSNPPLSLSFLVIELLHYVPAASRLDVLRRSLEHAGISTVVRIATTIVSEHGRLFNSAQIPDKKRVLPDPISIDTLQQHTLERIHTASETDELWNAPWLVRILSIWKLLGEEKQMRAWVAHRTESDADLIRLLTMIVGFADRRTALDAFFEPTRLADRIDGTLQMHGLPDRDMHVLRTAQKALRSPKRADDEWDYKSE